MPRTHTPRVAVVLAATMTIAASMPVACSTIAGLDDFELASSASSGGSGGSGSSSTASTGGGQGGIGGASPEDCLDGADNDGDGDADCADPDCDPLVECVPEPAPGWTGGLSVQQVAYPPLLPAEPCPDGAQPEVFYAGPDAQAQCASCDCSFTGASCTAPVLACYFAVSNCTNGIDYTTPANATACIADPPASSNFGGSCRLSSGPQVIDAGACMTSGGEMTNPLPWAEEIRVCAPASAGGGCGQGQACVPRPPAGFEALSCIRQDGAAACPAGFTDLAIQGYAGATDTRACTGCACDTSAVACSGGKYTAFDFDGCVNGMEPSIDIGAACVDVSALMDLGTFSLLPVPGTPSAGACTQSNPVGDLALTGPTQICCGQPVGRP